MYCDTWRLKEVGRQLLDYEKALLLKLLTNSRLYEVTRCQIGLNDEPYEALTETALKVGVTLEKLLNEILCERVMVET